MKVLDLRCANGHRFEGWFASDDDFLDQNGRGAIDCPLCADQVITRMPSAPRLNLSGARASRPDAEAPGGPASTPVKGTETGNVAAAAGPDPQPHAAPRAADLQSLWLQTVRQLMQQTEDVGPRFATEARRIHYGEVAQRGIRGQATAEEREALLDEGIETITIPVPHALKGPVQ